MNKGKLIVIDGIDGAGKTTQIELLGKYLSEKNVPYEVINFPRYGENIYADLVTRYLEGEFGGIENVNPYLMALAYAGDRLLAKTVIENWLNEGKIVLANRYVSSSKAHLGANLPEEKREEFMEWLDQLEYKTNGLPEEDLLILLDVDSSIGLKNVKNKHNPDIHEKNSEHEIAARNIYLELVKAEEWKVIDCMKGKEIKSKEEIHKLLVEIVSNILLS